jgi:hypothetical protein
VTKRTLLLLALAVGTGLPTMAACSTAERQAPLPPPVAGPTVAPTGRGAGPAAGSTERVPARSVPARPGAANRPGQATEPLKTGEAPVPAPGDVPGLPGSAGSAPVVGNGHHIGARAPWDLLLGDPHAETPPRAVVTAPVPAALVPVAPKPAEPKAAEPKAAAAKPSAPEPAAADDVVVLAEPGGHVSATVQPSLGRTVPVGGRQPVGDAVPDRVSFPALLSVLPPSAVDRPGAHPGRDQAERPPMLPNPPSPPADGPRPGRPPVLPAPSTPALVPPKRVHALTPPPSSSTPGPTTHPAPAAPPRPTPPVAPPWGIDGLTLHGPAAPATGRDGSPVFRAALQTALAQRPSGARPDPDALRRWSSALAKAALLAPDPKTKAELHLLAGYARELAATPQPARTALQGKRPRVAAAAEALRVDLPRRFGVALLD